MELSVVTTLYRSREYVREFYERTTKIAASLSGEYEIIFVNDGSPDDSLEIALAICKQDPRVVVVDLSRNFGHHRAILTGLRLALGRLVFLIDSDLEEKPELLAEFQKTMEASGADVVYGVQKQRTDPALRRLGAFIYYRVLNSLSDFPIPKNVMTVRLMTRRFVESLLLFPEREVVLSGIWQYAGFKQIPVEVEKLARSLSSYTLRRRVQLFIHSLLGFSTRPLVCIGVLGLTIVSLAMGYIAYLVAIVLRGGEPPSGYTSLMVSVWFLGGLIIFCIGIVALYLAVIFLESKHRPLTIVRAIYGRE